MVRPRSANYRVEYGAGGRMKMHRRMQAVPQIGLDCSAAKVAYTPRDVPKQAKFPVVKTMDSFDFLAIPSVNKTLVLELARCEFLARRENVLLLGNSGTGKTHIALARSPANRT